LAGKEGEGRRKEEPDKRDVSYSFRLTPRVDREKEKGRTTSPEEVEEDTTNSDSRCYTCDGLSCLGLNRFTGTMRTESDVVSCYQTISLSALPYHKSD